MFRVEYNAPIHFSATDDPQPWDWDIWTKDAEGEFVWATFRTFEALPPWVQEAIAVLDICAEVPGVGYTIKFHPLIQRRVSYELVAPEEIICYE